jgi:hypothetical protein
MEGIFSSVDKNIAANIAGGLHALEHVHYDEEHGWLYCSEHTLFGELEDPSRYRRREDSGRLNVDESLIRFLR